MPREPTVPSTDVLPAVSTPKGFEDAAHSPLAAAGPRVYSASESRSIKRRRTARDLMLTLFLGHGVL